VLCYNVSKRRYGLRYQNVFRYDYEKVDSAGADKMVERLNAFIADKANIGKEYRAGGKTLKIAKTEDFEYVDPIDESVAKKQVL